MGMLGLFLLSVLATPGQAFWSDRAPTRSDTALLQWCEGKVRQTASVKYEVDALSCANAYFFNQELELPGELFSKVLTFFYRAIALNPENADTQLTTLWLHYSRWTNHQTYPQAYPNYQNEIRVFYQLAQAIETRFSKSASVLKDLGDQVNFVRHYYHAPVFDWVLRLYTNAEAAARDDLKLQIRCRLDIAHLYRQTGDPHTAIKKYQWVQEIDPSNRVAARYLSELGSGQLIRLPINK
jgi:tetratricopeptide (TPR) repeat protein